MSTTVNCRSLSKVAHRGAWARGSGSSTVSRVGRGEGVRCLRQRPLDMCALGSVAVVFAMGVLLLQLPLFFEQDEQYVRPVRNQDS